MSARDALLREELVELATRQVPAGKRDASRLIASLAAFALAGAITGGTVAAVASSDAQDNSIDLQLISARIAGLQLVGEHTTLVGEPIEELITGNAELDLGSMPDGANSIAFALHCATVGTFSFALNGAPLGAISCNEEPDTEPGHGTASMFIAPNPDDVNTIDFTSEISGKYSVWVAWVTRPETPAPSAEQVAALADGIVDEAEYRAGLDRYVACMAEAGFTIDVLDTNEPIARYVISDEAHQDGANERCYISEFRDVDMQWQISING